MASRKVDFALKIESAATELAAVIEQIEVLRGAYLASGFDDGGDDELTDDDLVGHAVTAAKITTVMTLTENLTKFLDNLTPAKGDHRASLGTIRKF